MQNMTMMTSKDKLDLYTIYNKINEQQEIDEQRFFKTLFSTVDDLAKMPGLKGSLDDVLKFASAEGKTFSGKLPGAVNSTIAKNSDELFVMIKSGKLNAKSVGKLYSGLLKSAKTPASLIDDISKDLVSSGVFSTKYARFIDNKELARELAKAQYSPTAIKSILKHAKTDKRFLAARAKFSSKVPPSGGAAGGAAGGATGTLSSKFATRLKDIWLKNKKFVKAPALIKALGILGGAGLVAYFMAGGYTTPEDKAMAQELEESLNGFSDCILKYKDSLTVEIGEDNEPYLFLQKTGDKEYDSIGGLKFYKNGVVISGDGTKKGKYNCKEAINESMNLFSIGSIILSEQTSEITTGQIDAMAEKMVDWLDFPVTTNNLINAENALKSLVGKTVNGKHAGKEFLQAYIDTGLGRGSLAKTMKYIYTTKAKSSRSKRNILNLISQFETESDVPSTTKSSIRNNINIIWDGSAPSESKPSSQYKQCEGNPLPHPYGCTSSKIGQVQKCLGIRVDGKFGPETLNALKAKYDTTNGLTQEIYDDVIKNCGTTQQPRKEEIPLSVPSGASKISGQITQNPTKINRQSDPHAFYRALVANNMIDDAGSNNFRLRYKGEDLTNELLSSLDQTMSAMGYSRIKQLENLKPYGSKYVWQKNS